MPFLGSSGSRIGLLSVVSQVLTTLVASDGALCSLGVVSRGRINYLNFVSIGINVVIAVRTCCRASYSQCEHVAVNCTHSAYSLAAMREIHLTGLIAYSFSRDARQLVGMGVHYKSKSVWKNEYGIGATYTSTTTLIPGSKSVSILLFFFLNNYLLNGTHHQRLNKARRPREHRLCKLCG